MTGGSHCQHEREKGEGIGSVVGRMGCGLLPLLGQRGSPGSISIFFVFCHFLFSVFLFLSYLFQIGSKLIQTNLLNFLKFNLTF
jgi:hypothetical protein